jgi:hypothetical protein
VPDRDDRHAASGPFVQPAQDDGAGDQPDQEAQDADEAKVAVAGDEPELGQMPDRPRQRDEQARGDRAMTDAQAIQGESPPADLLTEPVDRDQ